MNQGLKTSARSIAFGAALLGSFILDGQIGSFAAPGFVAPAFARIGRPLTPISYAGVARRTTRRAVAVGVATRPVAVVAPPPTCVRVVDAYGRVTSSCP
jgi:hypothetical protein